MAKRPAKPSSARSAAADAPASPQASPARPTRLEQVLGQSAARRNLAAAIGSGRIHHAWIFHGPQGVGKFTAACAFAAALLDPTTRAGGGGDPAPDPDSPVQALCRSGNHPDLHIITRELAAISREKPVRDSKQTSISREVLDEFLLEPALRTRVMQGESLMGKVFIIDEAEMITPAVQNILLKTIEEPPPGTAIILVTSSEERLLPTIRSRCQRVAFQPLDEHDMEAWLRTAAPDLDPRRRAWLIVFSQGSPGLARLALDHDLYRWEESLAPLLAATDKGQFVPEFGSTLARLIAERAEADVKANPDASKDAANKAWARRMLAFIAEHHRGRLRASPPAHPDDAAAARALSALDAVQAAEGHLAAHVNLGLLLENLAAQLALEPVPA